MKNTRKLRYADIEVCKSRVTEALRKKNGYAPAYGDITIVNAIDQNNYIVAHVDKAEFIYTEGDIKMSARLQPNEAGTRIVRVEV